MYGKQHKSYFYNQILNSWQRRSSVDQKEENKQAGAELGQAKPLLGLEFRQARINWDKTQNLFSSKIKWDKTG